MTPTVQDPVRDLPLLYSRARQWHALRGFVLDALADAVHCHAALQGAPRCRLNLLLSRRHLDTGPLATSQRELARLSGELRRMGVPHAIHCVVPGDAEPAQHQLRITLSAASGVD